jgi:Flp pilus assembly protein TadD
MMIKFARMVCSVLVCLSLYACSSARNSEEDLTSEERLDQLYQNDQFKEAVSVLNQLVPQDSLNGELLFKRGVCYMQLFRYDSAEIDFKRSINLEYRLSDSYYNLALVQLAGLKDSLAVIYLEKALVYNPDFTEAQELLKDIKNKL